MKYNKTHTGLTIVVVCTILIGLILTGCTIAALTLGQSSENPASKTNSVVSSPVSDGQPTGNISSTGKTTNSDINKTGITANPTDERLTFQGKVISIDPSGKSFLVFVAGKDQKLLGDKASVDLYADATVTRADTGKVISVKEVPVNSEVTVTITGGIRESYPVQVSAVSVVVTMAGG